MAQWAAELRRVIAALFDDRGSLAEQHAVIPGALTDISSAASRAGFDEPIGAAVVRAELETAFDEVDPDGNVTFTVQGIRGKGCQGLAQALAEAMGGDVSDQGRTREYHLRPWVRAHRRAGRR